LHRKERRFCTAKTRRTQRRKRRKKEKRRKKRRKEKGEGKKMDIEEVGEQIVDAAIKVHRALGPGLLESSYQACLTFELQKRGLTVVCEVPQPVNYEGVQIEAGYRLDMLVEDVIVIENKAVEQVLPIHIAQLLTYLKLSDRRLGYLINWNVSLVKDGIYRRVNNL
jgi:GxxExxY protein